MLSNDRAGALTALVLYAVGGAVGIVWRSWYQWRRTGSTGLKGVSGRPGSAEWLGGVGLILAVVTTAVAPVLQRRGVVEPLLDAGWARMAGLALAVVGIIAVVYAQLALGDSWRIGVDESETTTLVRGGVFGVVRNPIYLAMFTFWLGTTLLAPNIIAVIGYLLLLASIELQVRLVEEPHLLRVHGDVYRDYMRAVGRFIPGVGRVR